MLSSENTSIDHPSKPSIDKLVYMANQIATFFKTQDLDTASAKVAEHISKFWDPRMRRAIVARLDAGGAGLDPVAGRAVDMLRGKT